MKYKRIINAVILGFLPVIACLINLLVHKKLFADLWLGQSQWNDELFYFKQIECMVKDTIPKGFFGYNESQAQFLSFGAWSPVILLPWALWGKIFGWTYLSPIIANVAYLTLAMFLFGIFAKPTFTDTMSIAAIFLLVTPLSRYMFSGMPEIVCLVPLIIVLGLSIGYVGSKHKKGRMAAMLVLLAMLTLMRPYFFVFFIIPFFICKRDNVNGKFATIVVAVISVLLYFVMSSKMNAPYFTDVYRTDWVDAFKSEGLKGGFVYLIKELILYMKEILVASVGGIRGGYPIGIYFAAFLFVIFEFFLLSIFLLIKKDKRSVYAICMFFCQFAMLGAICLMYSLQDGFRHLLIFIVGGLFLSVFTLRKKGLRRIQLAINLLFIAWLFVVKAKDPMYFATVFNDEKEASSQVAVAELKEELEGKMESSKELSWDNDLALVFMDSNDGSDARLIRWQYAYAVPEGFAISLCDMTYLSENVSNIKSRYVMTMTGGEMEKLLLNKKAELLASNADVSVYKMP